MWQKIRKKLGSVKELHVWRVSTVGILLAAGLAPFGWERPKKLPDVAMGSTVILHFEETLIIFLILSALAVFLVRGWRGEVPTKTTHTGTEYQELRRKQTDELANQTDKLQVQIDLLRRRVRKFDLSRKHLNQIGAQMEAMREEIAALAEEVELLAGVVLKPKED
jgi:hypothetical protein